MAFVYASSVKMHHTDAAGLLFFAHQLAFVHDCYEAFLEEAGCSMRYILSESDFLLPIIKAESEYKKSLFVGDELCIEMTCESNSTHAFVLVYRLLNVKKELVGSAKTVHICIDKTTRAKKELPKKLRDALIHCCE
ncbi:MAG: thioesterase family protein [candidate division Zixibacteria bacterium]|nr:thioesterase family protein [candidate division Zixibacteria bacterium]